MPLTSGRLRVDRVMGKANWLLCGLVLATIAAAGAGAKAFADEEPAAPVTSPEAHAVAQEGGPP